MGIFDFKQAMFIIAGSLLISLITLFTLRLAKNDQKDLVDTGAVEIPN